MSGLPDIIREVRRWIEKAENDRRNAEYVLTMKHGCPTDTVCFHCQQCAEKYLKAALIFQGKPFPRSHDLNLLANLLGEMPFQQLRNGMQRLNLYSSEPRYPGEWEPTSRAQAEQALEWAMEIRDAVRSLLPGEALSPETGSFDGV